MGGGTGGGPPATDGTEVVMGGSTAAGPRLDGTEVVTGGGTGGAPALDGPEVAVVLALIWVSLELGPELAAAVCAPLGKAAVVAVGSVDVSSSPSFSRSSRAASGPSPLKMATATSSLRRTISGETPA